MDKQLNFHGSLIHYRVTGTGRPVILVHGFGETSHIWDNQVEELEKTCRVIVPDLPGTGSSAVISDMSMEGLAAAITAVITNEDLQEQERPVVLGHSMGGYIVMALMASPAADNISAFGLIHSTAFPDTTEKIETRRKGIRFIREHGATAFLKNTSPNLFSSETKTGNPQLIDEFIDGLHGFSDETLIAFYEGMIARPDRTDVLKATTLPVLFVFGKHDTAVPPEDGLKQTHFAEKSYIHMLPHSGHLGMIEEPAKMNQIIGQFISET